MGRKSRAQRRALSHQRDQSCFQHLKALVEAARRSPACRGALASPRPGCCESCALQEPLSDRVASGAITYLRSMSPLLEQRAAVSALTPVLLMELLCRLTQTEGGVRMGQLSHRCGAVFGVRGHVSLGNWQLPQREAKAKGTNVEGAVGQQGYQAGSAHSRLCRL